MGKAGAARRAGEADDLFARIGSFLVEHRLPPEPEHYAFAHRLLSRPDSTLAAEVARLTDGGVRLTRAAIELLGGRVAATASVPADERGPAREEDAQRLVAETQAQVDGFADMMRAMRIETRGFGRDLAQSAAAMVRAEPVHGALPGTRDVARIAGAMIERVRESEAKLARATEETDALRAKLAEARATARRDPLTGLANRLGFAEAFAARDTAAAPHCIALCDIDRFKRINDEHGHGVGDRVLVAIGRSLSEMCDGHVVSRHGGEEFAVLLGGIELPQAIGLLDGTRATVAGRRFRDRETGAGLGTITFSAGVTAIHAGEGLDRAIERADRLLYAAKADGRDRVCAG
jgi:diguanylate cyclase